MEININVLMLFSGFIGMGISVITAFIFFILFLLFRNNKLKKIIFTSLKLFTISFVITLIGDITTEPTKEVVIKSIKKLYPEAKNIKLKNLNSIIKYNKYRITVTFDTKNKKCDYTSILKATSKLDTWDIFNENISCK